MIGKGYNPHYKHIESISKLKVWGGAGYSQSFKVPPPKMRVHEKGGRITRQWVGPADFDAVVKVNTISSGANGQTVRHLAG